mgnify:CR=1 FL=1
MKPAIISCMNVAGIEGSKPSAKQSSRPTEIAAAHDTRLRQLQDLAASDDSDVSEPAKADTYHEFGAGENAE